MQRDVQGVVRDERHVGQRGDPGGWDAEWRARFAVLEGERSGRHAAPYAAPPERQGAQGGRSLEQDESSDALRPKRRRRR